MNRTAAVSIKLDLSLLRVSIDLPVAAERKISSPVADEALHILQRVAQKDADFMGKLLFQTQPARELPQQLLPSTADEEEIKNFYTSYVERLQEVGNFYTAQTRAAVQDILDPQVTDEGVVENVIIQSILQSGFSRIMAEKLLHLQDADPERVLELEKISDGRGRHPLGQLPEKED